MLLQDFAPLEPKIVLGVAAHPDDLDFSAAGTLAKYAAAGARVHYLILTDGSKGSEDFDMSPDRLIGVRQTEQRAANALIGGAGVEFLAYGDGELEVTQDLKRDIARVIRSLKPDVIITMDPGVLYSPLRGFINHPDHRAAGQATLDAVYPLARDHLSYPELSAAGYMPHKTPTILLSNFDDGNYLEDISSTINKKYEALAAHPSQIPDILAVQERVGTIAKAFGVQAGCEYAEAFVRIDIA